MSTTTYTNLRYIPTKKIIEILDNPHHLSSSGKDFGPVIDELRDILWERQSRQKAMSKIEEYEAYSDHNNLPPFNKETHPEYFKALHNEFLSELL